MKARLLEAAGGKPGHASFSGPPSRTAAADAAGPGTFVSGVLGAALLAAAAALLAPGEARAQTNSCGTPDADGALSCADQAWANGILHTMSASAPALSLTVGGGPATTITALQNSSGIGLDAALTGATGDQTLTVGNDGAVVIMPASGATVTTGIGLRQRGSGTAGGDVSDRVTIGSESNPIATGVSGQARGAGGFSLTSAARIHATTAGLLLWRPAESGTTTPAATSLENRGAITTSGDGIRVEYATPSAATQSGAITIVNSGAITVTGDGYGIRLSPIPVASPVGFNPYGDLTVINSGDITARDTDGDGIHVAYSEGNTASSGDIDITNSGDITANRYGIHVENHGRGDIALTSTGDVESATFHAIHARTAQDGAIRVTVAEGARVTGSMAGVHVADAGTGLMVARKYTSGFARGEDPEELVAATYGEGAVALRNQLVTVRGAVTGGTEAAVRLSGGGGVLVLAGGEVRAGSSGTGIAADGPALVYVDGEVRGAAGGDAAVHLTGGGSVTVGLKGRVLANGAGYAIRGAAGAPVTVTLVIDGPVAHREDAARVEGGYRNVENVLFREDRNGVPTGYSTTLPVGDDGRLDAVLPLRFYCDAAGDRRCRMYEALPSMLLALNALPSWAQRSAAPRDANGAWASVEASRGEWRAKKATTAGQLAYDHRWFVGRMGVDFTPREDLRVGWSVHVPRGKAEMAGVGEVELDGVGAGVSATWRSGDLYVDAQAAVTRYDVGFESDTHGELLDNGVSGVGYALGVEGGKRMPVGGTFVTPRAGLAWSDVDLGDFTDLETAGGPRARVSVEDAGSVKGRVGVTVEKEVGMGAVPGLLFGSLDVEREFSDETEVRVRERMLKTTVRSTAVSLGAGAAFDVDENVLVRAVAGYRTSGGGTSGYRGGLELQVRF